MKKEAIEDLIIRLETRQQVFNEELGSFLYHYIYETKGIEVEQNTFALLQHAFGVERMIRSAVDFYKNKYCCQSLYTKDGVLIKAWF